VVSGVLLFLLAKERGADMNVVVHGTPESCLAQVEAFFAHGWPHGGNYRRPTPNTLTLAALAPRHYLFESIGGIVLILVLSLITAGAFLAAYVIYFMVRNLVSGDPAIYTARVVATPESSTQTQLLISASREDWERTLESWVQQELVENKAAKVPLQDKGPLFESSDTAGEARDIPKQLERLAELRDAGVITAEDFDKKKRDLLDRM